MSLFLYSLHLRTLSVRAHFSVLAPFLKTSFWVVLPSLVNKSQNGSASVIAFAFPLHLDKSKSDMPGKGNNTVGDTCDIFS